MPSSRAGLIDLVQDGDGRHQEDAVQALVKADINVDLVQWDVLALLHDPGLDGLGKTVTMWKQNMCFLLLLLSRFSRVQLCATP